MTPKRIAYIGNFMAKNRHGDPYNTEAHLALSLESLGHAVTRIQEGPPETVHGTTAEKILAQVEQEGSDLLLWTRTWRLPGDCLGMLARCRERKVPTVAYHLDLYAPIARGRSGGHNGHGVTDDPWWRSAHVFTPDGGSDSFWPEHGINHHYMPPAVYHGECTLATPDPALASDVLFVGSYNYGHSEWPYRRTLIDWLKATYGDRFRCVPTPGGDVFRGRDLNALYASAKVVVGDSLVPGFTHENYTSDRLFETLGRGGFLVYPRIKGITDGTLVTEGEHIAAYTFNDWAELRSVIDRYLERADERERIRLAGHEHVKANHTYRHRLEAMLATVAAAEGWPA